MRSRYWIMLLPVLLTAGCSPTPSFRYGRIPTLLPTLGSSSGTFGRLPDIESSLSVLMGGESGKADVLRVLGAPRGYGRARLTSDSKPQVVWHYDYLEAHDNRFDIRYLILFFEAERFVGYLWFTATQEMHKQ